MLCIPFVLKSWKLCRSVQKEHTGIALHTILVYFRNILMNMWDGVFCRHAFQATLGVVYRHGYRNSWKSSTLQHIANCLRSGFHNNIQLECFVEALHDPSSKFTYPALTGQRKQSVSDTEHLLSKEMVAFMERYGYVEEARYLRVIANWRAACDERGLSELECSCYNYELLNYLLDDLMPWHSEMYDFSLLEVTR